MKIYKKDSRGKSKIPLKHIMIGFFASLLLLYVTTISMLMKYKQNENHDFVEKVALTVDGSTSTSNATTSSESKPKIVVVKEHVAVPAKKNDIVKPVQIVEQKVEEPTKLKLPVKAEEPPTSTLIKNDVPPKEATTSTAKKQTNEQKNEPPPTLKAYIEKIDQSEWQIKPLPTRKTKSSDLIELSFSKVNSCKRLPEQWPVDENVAPTNKDPFLPWIHDVFPTADGKYIQFIAQNKRRCQTGRRKTEIKKFMQPNVALFQHVPIKRVKNDGGETRYKLTSHEEADSDGVETRFICRFKPSMEETLSVFNFNYDFHTLRKSYSATFTEAGFDNHMIWTSQLLFRCPVPESLQEDIKSGKSVINDYASLFVDLIPIRTPPRYGHPTTYLPPRLFDKRKTWDVKREWGNHTLPFIEDSGRWENIPICKPSLMQYPDEAELQTEHSYDTAAHAENDAKMLEIENSGQKKHKLISCTWTSAAFKTRGGRTSVNDGQERLFQWLAYNKLAGIDHVYIYDNSGAFSNDRNLKPVTDKFPGFVTRINWPAKVCNNNRGNADNKGERSSQYAADASCRLRFGAHSTWLASVDTDEYLVPLEKYKDLKGLLDDVEKEDIRVLNFYSKRSKARLRYLNTAPVEDRSCNMNSCFDPSLQDNDTFLEVYNCNNELPPRKDVQPAEKAIYKPDYVLQFFVHYAAVTQLSATGKAEAALRKEKWFIRYNYKNHLRYVDEKTEATMLHTKAIVAKETREWKTLLSSPFTAPRSLVGVEWPDSTDESKIKDETQMSDTTVEIDGNKYYPNCYPIPWISEHWSPRLHKALKDQVGER